MSQAIRPPASALTGLTDPAAETHLATPAERSDVARNWLRTLGVTGPPTRSG